MNPPLKWVGGKRWLLPILKDLWAPYADCKLVEPFMGGLSVALGLNPKHALLNDANVHLVNFYDQLKTGLQIKQAFKNNVDFYYAMRETFNTLIYQKKHQSQHAASLFYFLIRTGFNGLCRFNHRGEFNVPFGSHKSIRYKTDFLEYQVLLQKWEFTQGDFEYLILHGNEFVYADPPYDMAFTQYHTRGFTWTDQVRLATWLCTHKGPVVASNQATKRILELYQDLRFMVFTLPGPRSIACTGDRRPVLEMLALKGGEWKRSSLRRFLR